MTFTGIYWLIVAVGLLSMVIHDWRTYAGWFFPSPYYMVVKYSFFFWLGCMAMRNVS